MRYTITESVVTEPITLTEAKAYLQIDTDLTEDDDLIEDVLIPAVRTYLESTVDKSLASQQYTVLFDCVEQNLELPFGPVTTLDNLYAYVNGDYVEITSGYRLIKEVPALIYFTTIPTADIGPAQLKAVYTAGSTISPLMKVAFLFLLKDWYENRINIGGMVSGETAKAVNTIITREALCRL